MSVFSFRPKDQHPQLVNEANTGSLSLRPAASPLQNLQHPITQILLCGATEVNEKFLGQDLNLLDRLPVTAYGLTPFTVFFSFELKVIILCILKIIYPRKIECTFNGGANFFVVMVFHLFQQLISLETQ